jgi:hypothetical protein
MGIASGCFVVTGTSKGMIAPCIDSFATPTAVFMVVFGDG